MAMSVVRTTKACFVVIVPLTMQFSRSPVSIDPCTAVTGFPVVAISCSSVAMVMRNLKRHAVVSTMDFNDSCPVWRARVCVCVCVCAVYGSTTIINE